MNKLDMSKERESFEQFVAGVYGDPSASEWHHMWEAWLSRAQLDSGEWVSVEDMLPAIGQTVILYGNGVVQRETFQLDASDISDYHTEYFWSRDDLEEGIPITADQKWLPLPQPPEEK